MTRGKGWQPDDPQRVFEEHRDKHVGLLLEARAPKVAGALSIDFTAMLDRIPDQRSTSSCVGHAFSSAMLMTALLAGVDIVRPSPKAIYDFARLKDQPYASLSDDGSRPLAAAETLRDKGMVAEAEWRLVFDDQGGSNVNAPPPLDVYEQALGAKLGDYYRIPAGVGAFDLVYEALVRQLCPVFAMPVDEDYERFFGSGVYEGRTGPSLGGHMQAIGGAGDGYVLVPGSWGTAWADGGIIKISKDYLESGECTDIIVATVIPTF